MAISFAMKNPVVFPFSIIDKLHPRQHRWKSLRNKPWRLWRFPEQFAESFWQQVAKVIIQLASLRSPKIDSIIHGPSNPDALNVGQLAGTCSSPYDSAVNFYNDYLPVPARVLSSSELRGNRHDEVIGAFRSPAASFSPTVPAGSTVSARLGLAN